MRSAALALLLAAPPAAAMRKSLVARGVNVSVEEETPLDSALNASAFSELQLQSVVEAEVRDAAGNFVMNNIGGFSGVVVQSNFGRATWWNRNCRHHMLRHSVAVLNPVFVALYNDCAGVSDAVYYVENRNSFCSGCGRGGSWRNDPQLDQLYAGQPLTSRARAADYEGVGFFMIDRGHQAPVGSLNANDEMATVTNNPSNLSPQSAELNRRNWMYLESEMRDRTIAEQANLDILTGPVYELPPALFQNARGRALWTQLLETGGAINGQSPWCSDREGNNFRSRPLANRGEMVRCTVEGTAMNRATDNLNRIQMRYQRSANNMALRAPLGYYKVMVLEGGRVGGRRVCAYLMDQVGQCLVVSLPLISELARISFANADFVRRGVPQAVDASYCLIAGGLMQRRNFCETATASATASGAITVAMMDGYWRRVDAAAR